MINKLLIHRNLHIFKCNTVSIERFLPKPNLEALFFNNMVIFYLMCYRSLIYMSIAVENPQVNFPVELLTDIQQPLIRWM